MDPYRLGPVSGTNRLAQPNVVNGEEPQITHLFGELANGAAHIHIGRIQ